MRITGGALAGRRVDCPPGIIRPAMDRMRESLFAALGSIAGRPFLDLFSGSGIVALEAVSRGAAPVEAVESDVKKRSRILKNISISGGVIRCRFMPVELYVRRVKGRSFDYIFCDPPYSYKFNEELLMNIASSGLMSVHGLLILHRPREKAALTDNLILIEQKEYGRSVVDIFKSAVQYGRQEC